MMEDLLMADFFRLSIFYQIEKYKPMNRCQKKTPTTSDIPTSDILKSAISHL